MQILPGQAPGKVNLNVFIVVRNMMLVQFIKASCNLGSLKCFQVKYFQYSVFYV